jgi:hypothetical protein
LTSPVPTNRAAWDEGDVLGRLEILVVNDLGREDTVSVTFRRDTVEVWADRRSRGVFDREELGAWLTWPAGSISSTDDVRLSAMPARVALGIGGLVSSWALDERALRELRTRV